MTTRTAGNLSWKRSNGAERTATSASYSVGAAMSIFGGLTANEVAMIGGFVIGALTFIVNAIYRHLHYKLEKRRVELMAKARGVSGERDG